MAGTYLNSKGEIVVISDMPDAYLINSLRKHKEDLRELREKLAEDPTQIQYVFGRVKELERIIAELRSEIESRDIL